MKIFLIHNSYQTRGGEEALFETERRVLLAHGHEVIEYRRHNNEIREFPAIQRMMLPVKAIWAWDSFERVQAICLETRPHVAILFNTLPLISPAVVHACLDSGVPILQHYQNYRLVCSSGVCFRAGKVCQECLEHGLWRGIQHSCYRDSRLATAVVAAHTAFHRTIGTWSRRVSGFIAPSMFIREIAIRGGIPAERVHLKPNCVDPDPGMRTGFEQFALYAGRLSPEKGVRTLITAWGKISGEIPLWIAGDGPLRGELENTVAMNGIKNVTFLGSLSHPDLISLLKRSRLLVLPTECYEGFPMAVVEGLACGTPILAARIGAVEELLSNGKTGFFFETGDPESLASTALRVWNSTDALERVSRRARAEYEAKYTGAQNHMRLMHILTQLGVCSGQSETDGNHRFSEVSKGAQS